MSEGRAWLLPIGIATDDTTSDFFSDLVGKANLVQLLGFENESFIFPEVHHSFKFCALTISGIGCREAAFHFAFFCREFSQAIDANRAFQLTACDLNLLSPQPGTARYSEPVWTQVDQKDLPAGSGAR